MIEACLVRRRRFRARHHYARPSWTAERNREVFGAQTEPHEHDWVLEVRVAGPIDPATGFCVDLGALDRWLDELTAGWDGGDLNALIPAVAAGDVIPSTEGLARWLFGELSPRVPAPARIQGVAVFESEDLGAEYPARGPST